MKNHNDPIYIHVTQDRNLWNKFAEILPGMLQEIRTFLDVEVTGINDAAWVKHRSGLQVAELEVVEDENCARFYIRQSSIHA